ESETPNEPEPALAASEESAGAEEFAVLPGESLAKYRHAGAATALELTELSEMAHAGEAAEVEPEVAETDDAEESAEYPPDNAEPDAPEHTGSVETVIR